MSIASNKEKSVNILMKYMLVTGDFELKYVKISNRDGSYSVKPVLGDVKLECLDGTIGKSAIWYNATQIATMLR
jgi:hypothetical protein